MEQNLIDLMPNGRQEIRIHEHGLIALVDVMPRLVPEGQTADSAVCQAARVSYGAGTKQAREDRGLIRYLLRNQHVSPFEMVEFKFHMAMPIFVARQIVRHRTANLNEQSGRYSVMTPKFYIPKDVRVQSTRNKQGSTEGEVVDAETRDKFVGWLQNIEDEDYQLYEELIKAGVSRELARIGLPLNLYTEWYWKCDLRNILHFLELRLDTHAQEETRAYAQAMLQLIEPLVPWTIEAFRDYVLESVRLFRPELEAIHAGTELVGSADEKAELESKLRRIGGAFAPAIPADEPKAVPSVFHTYWLSWYQDGDVAEEPNEFEVWISGYCGNRTTLCARVDAANAVDAWETVERYYPNASEHIRFDTEHELGWRPGDRFPASTPEEE